MSYPATRIRQPGGVRVKCEQGYGQTCGCGVFNNYGMPQVVSVGFSGFGTCSSQCDLLNSTVDDPGGSGPFACQYQLTNGTLPDPAGAANITGSFCVWVSDEIALADPVANQSTACKVFFAIGQSSDGNGVCAAVWVQGTHSFQNYLVWTWKHLPVAPGLLGCDNETQVPLAYTLAQLVNHAHTPDAWEWNGDPPAPNGQNWFCANCPTLSPAWAAALPAAEAGASCDGTGKTAPPCCCGGQQHRCLFLCIKCGGAYCGLGLCQNGKGEWTGEDQNASCHFSASLSAEGGQWTITWTGADCSGSYTFDPSEINTGGSFSLVSGDGNIAITSGSATGKCAGDLIPCDCGDGQPYGGNAPASVDVDPEGLLKGALGYCGVSEGGCVTCGSFGDCGGLNTICGPCYPLGATAELVSTGGGQCATYNFLGTFPGANQCGPDLPPAAPSLTQWQVSAVLQAGPSGCTWTAVLSAGVFGHCLPPGTWTSLPFSAADSPTEVELFHAAGVTGVCQPGGVFPCGLPDSIKLYVNT